MGSVAELIASTPEKYKWNEIEMEKTVKINNEYI